MNQSSWERAKSLLADAAALPPSDRERYVVENCPDPELQREVLDWLASPAALTGILSVSALTPGARLGPFVIDRLIGRGGMGEVYKATDSSLNRSVAIKVLPAVFDGDPDRQARLRREARLLAALNHPNIAHIHGFEESSGVAALVMEFVDGPTLADHLQRPMPLGEVLTTARQVADALEAAHAQGIIHRDLKPANIKVREDGTVKVLDFGLARTLDVEAAPSVVTNASPRMSFSGTHPGVVIGTPAYMAPEQALGKTADKRADIWSFGCVLYEMLSGRRAFQGTDVSDTLSRVIGNDPDWAALPPKTPEPLRRLLRRCLEKPANKRLADIADARLEIEEALSPSAWSAATTPRPMAVVGWSRALPWAVAAACVGALALVLIFGSPRRNTPPARLMNLSVDLGLSGEPVTPKNPAEIAFSPDGAHLAFTASKPSDSIPRLYLRNLDRPDTVVLTGTEGATGPFFSPEGQWIGFFADKKLKKIAVTGGSPIDVCAAAEGRGGSWGDDGTIVFAPEAQSELWRVSSDGGTPKPITTLDAGEKTQRWPQSLPGGQAVLYTSLSPANKQFNFADASLIVQAGASGPKKVVMRGATYGRYVPTGHLLYLRDDTLFAAPFDLERLELTGPEWRVTDRLISNPTAGTAMFAISPKSGGLVYVRRSVEGDDKPVTWLDRSGRSTVLRSTPATWTDLSFAPDGRRLAFTASDGKQSDIWIDDLDRDALTRVTNFNSGSGSAVWTPDGTRIAFASMLGEKEVGLTYNLHWMKPDGSGYQRLTTSTNLQLPGSWHPKERILAFTEQRPRSTIMLLPVLGDETSGWKPGNPTILSPSGDFDERVPTFSRDGHWLAYESNRSGTYNVYVRPFPGPGTETQISTEGGFSPRWSQTRPELIFESPDHRVMVVNYFVKANMFGADKPRPWPEAQLMPQRTHVRVFDLHPDGQRLAVLAAGGTTPPRGLQRLGLMLNFFDELRRIAPVQPR